MKFVKANHLITSIIFETIFVEQLLKWRRTYFQQWRWAFMKSRISLNKHSHFERIFFLNCEKKWKIMQLSENRISFSFLPSHILFLKKIMCIFPLSPVICVSNRREFAQNPPKCSYANNIQMEKNSPQKLFPFNFFRSLVECYEQDLRAFWWWFVPTNCADATSFLLFKCMQMFELRIKNICDARDNFLKSFGHASVQRHFASLMDFWRCNEEKAVFKVIIPIFFSSMV